jgi:hypothetical protein
MEAMGGDLREMQRIPLAPAHVAALREAGAVVHYETGAFLARPGRPIDRFTLDPPIVESAYLRIHVPERCGSGTQTQSSIQLNDRCCRQHDFRPSLRCEIGSSTLDRPRW